MTMIQIDRPSQRAAPVTRTRRAAQTWGFAPLAMLLVAFVVLAPSVRGVHDAFTDWDGLDPAMSFLGPRNFGEMVRDLDAIKTIWHALLIAVAITIIQNGVGLLLAFGVNTMMKSRNVLRVVRFAPGGRHTNRDGVPVAQPARPERRVKSLLGAVGLEFWQQDWVGDPQLALWSICLAVAPDAPLTPCRG